MAAATMLASSMPTPTLDAPQPTHDELRERVAAKREATRMKRWRHRAVNTPLNGVGLHHLMALSDRDWRRWPRVGGGAHREGLDNSGVMVFTAEDFDSDAFEGDDGEAECDGRTNSSSNYYGSSSTSSSSSDSEGELSDDWEDPLWVKDDNVRTEGRCDWTPPRPLQVVRQAEPDDDDDGDCRQAATGVGVKTAKKNESGRKETKRGEDRDGMLSDEVEHLVSSNELSWVIDSNGRQSSSEEVVMELEEQDAEEEDHRTRARGGTESSYERGAEYLLQKYFCSLPTFPTRAGSRTSAAQQVIEAQQHRQRAETTTTTTTTTTPSKNEENEAAKNEEKKWTSKKEKKTKKTTKKEKSDGGKKVMVPRIEGLSLNAGDCCDKEDSGSSKRRPKRNKNTQEKTSSCPTPRTAPLAEAPETPREVEGAAAAGPSSAAKGSKGGPGRNLVNFFNLSPRRPRDPANRRSSFIRRRSIEEEAEAAAAHEAALRHLQLQQQQQPHLEEVGDEADVDEEWTQGLRKPRRKRSISIPLSSYRLELEFMSLKSALSKGDSGGSGNGESGSGGGKAARKLRRKGAAEGSSSKKTRQGHKFNTITSMTDTRQYYFMDEFDECESKKKAQR